MRGVSHNDIRPENILVDEYWRPFLIDFDQATIASPLTCLARSIFGMTFGKGKTYGSFTSMLKWTLRRYLPPHIQSRFKRAPPEIDHTLPPRESLTSDPQRAMWDAWSIAQASDASSPGVPRAYYSIDFEGVHFPGERPWNARWEQLRQIRSFANIRTLELGCNVGLLSTFLSVDAKATETLGVDADEEILRAARIVATTHRANSKFVRVDFDSKNSWESGLVTYKPDVVFALNVLNWVKDKERFLHFLGHFSELIFEGHDSAIQERHRMSRLGFRAIELVTITERNRPLLYCRK
jgi:hypothetical protein